MHETSEDMSCIVVGASGHLALRKVVPALFALYCQGLLPKGFNLFGFARSELGDAEFRDRIAEHLTCRYTSGQSCEQKMKEFLARCHYVRGEYASSDSFLDLFVKMREIEGGRRTNRFYYLAIPPSIFLDVAHSIGDAGLVSCGTNEPWSRVVIEKPFGHDRQSSDMLTEAMAKVFVERQIFRIDHYLGKEVIQNLLVLRFANAVFQPLWNRDFIRSVRILWKEDLGLEGRGGYFDQYGIIRDVMQNHLLQILALIAMEPPERLDARHIARAKVNVLRSVPPVSLDNLVIGQYTESVADGRRLPAYAEDETIAADSITPTYAAARLSIDNPRWQGVPFLIEAGKGLDARMTEIRIQFREVPGNMFCRPEHCPEANELVVRVQPDEAIQLSIMGKVPGMGMTLQSTSLDMLYRSAFPQQIPDAYESLLLDAMRGDKSLFIRSDELEAAWDIFTPALQEIESRNLVPDPYPFGSTGPAAAKRLLS